MQRNGKNDCLYPPMFLVNVSQTEGQDLQGELLANFR